MTKRKGPVDPDPRADEMTLEALGCRANGGRHALEPLAHALKRARIGQGRAVDVERFCLGECGYSVTEVYSLSMRERVSRTTHYPKTGYLTPKDSGGRMASTDALTSLLSRIYE